jgi:hypothetical protein
VGTDLKNTVISLSGGSRLLQTFGAEIQDIQFSGTFMYDDAVGRAKALNTLAEAGGSLTFICDFYNAPVIIKTYQFKIYNAAKVDYTITLFVDRQVQYLLQDARLQQRQSTNNAAAAQIAASGNTVAQISNNVLQGKYAQYGVLGQ